MELKVIHLDRIPRIGAEDGIPREDGRCNVFMFDTKTLKNQDNYIQTKIGIGDKLTLNTDRRKSFTYNKRLRLEPPFEMLDFLNSHSILQGPDYAGSEILKYETGDFFMNHTDTIMSDPNGIGEHKYTCLIYGTFEQENGYFEGGELVFKHPEGLYNIKLDVSNEITKNKYVAVIFSVNMYHEILPIINGTRYVLKKPLFVRTPVPPKPYNPDEMEGDGGFQSIFNGRGGDY